VRGEKSHESAALRIMRRPSRPRRLLHELVPREYSWGN
jgi:hypothetical protein